LIKATTQRLDRLNIGSVEQVRRYPRRLAGLSPGAARNNARLKQFLHRKLYSHANISAERRHAVRHVEKLFHYFLKHPHRLPGNYFAKTNQEPVYRVVCDYIAGMTDNYLELQYRKYLV